MNRTFVHPHGFRCFVPLRLAVHMHRMEFTDTVQCHSVLHDDVDDLVVFHRLMFITEDMTNVALLVIHRLPSLSGVLSYVETSRIS